MFVPRKEYSLLKEKLDVAISERIGSTIFLYGDAGVGKSTLMEQFLEDCDRLYDINVLTASGSCFDMDGVSRGFLPWKEVLIELDADKNAGKDEEKKDDFKKAVKNIFDNSGAEWIQNIPAIGELSAAVLETAKAIQKTETIDIKSGDVTEMSFKDRLKYVLNQTTAAWLGAIPFVGGFAEAVFKTSQRFMEDSQGIHMKNQEGFFLMVDEKLRQLAEENPIVIFLDNLQWADLSSLNLLYYIAKKLKDKPYPLLMICVYRKQEVQVMKKNPTNGELERHPLVEKINNLERYDAVESVELQSFSKLQVESYINSIYRNNEFSSDFFDEIYTLTKGNPLFLDEMLRNLEETNVIEKIEDKFIIINPIDFVSLPKSVTAIIKERFERLSDDLQEFLQIAAVQGENFTLDIMSTILEENTVKVLRKNDILIQKYNLIEPSNKISEALGDMFRFTHDLVQSYIYNDMSADYRNRIHRMIAEQYEGHDNVEALHQFIYHYGVGNQILSPTGEVIISEKSQEIEKEKVKIYLDSAKKIADRLSSTLKNDEALKICSEIVDIAGIVNDYKTKVEYSLKQGEILKLQGKWKEAEAIYQTAFQYALKINSNIQLKIASKALAKIISRFALTSEKSGNWSEAVKQYHEALVYSEHTYDPIFIADAHKKMSWSLVLTGNYIDAVEHMQKALDKYSEINELEQGKKTIAALIKKSVKLCRGVGDMKGDSILNEAYKKFLLSR